MGYTYKTVLILKMQNYEGEMIYIKMARKVLLYLNKNTIGMQEKKSIVFFRRISDSLVGNKNISIFF